MMARMEQDWARLGRAVAVARQDAGMTQNELATAVGVGLSTIKTLERGSRKYLKVQPTHRGVARALGWAEDCVEDVLAGGDPRPEPALRSTIPVPTGELPAGLSERAKWALGSGRVVDSDVISASPGGDGGVEVVMVFKAAEGVSPEQLSRDFAFWERMQRLARDVWTHHDIQSVEKP
ncbi:hypothetical protein GCM10010193_70910 [Kitasatospora atroaurantiaca]